MSEWHTRVAVPEDADLICGLDCVSRDRWDAEVHDEIASGKLANRGALRRLSKKVSRRSERWTERELDLPQHWDCGAVTRWQEGVFSRQQFSLRARRSG